MGTTSTDPSGVWNSSIEKVSLTANGRDKSESRRPQQSCADDLGVEGAQTERGTLLGGIGSLLAVGCPTCNQVVVAALGTSGALSLFQPVQPWLGLASLGLLTWLLRRRGSELRRTSCPV